MKALLTKTALPLVLCVGGVVAWGVGLWPTAPSGVAAAWIDAPIDGSTFDVGPVTVRAHAGGPDRVDRIRFFVDGVAFATRGVDTGERVATASARWPGRSGLHRLTVSGHTKAGWGPSSSPISVQIGGERTSGVPPSGSRPSVPTTATSTSSSSSSSPSTTSPSTTSPPTSVAIVPRPTTSTTRPSTTAPLPALTLTVEVSPEPGHEGEPVTFLATVGNRAGHDVTIEIEATENPRNPASAMIEIGSCRSSPCRITHRFDIRGTYRFQVTASTDDGRHAETDLQTLLVTWEP